MPGALLIGVAAWGTVQWLLQDLRQLPVPQQISARIEAMRTGLATAAGVGAAVTLMLAVRRQRHQELTAAHTTHDAAERRVTELYTKAIEQLGNAQAPVRLGGLYALERLAQDTPALRQTVVDVICAYLRMPYQAPAEEAREPGVPRGAVGGVARVGARHDPQEERQVRLTAQRILVDHLRYRPPAGRRGWRRPPDPNVRHWPGTRLDLTGATLIDLSLVGCRIGEAEFRGARFVGTAGFGGAVFTGAARFGGACFAGAAEFRGTDFTGAAEFGETLFCGDAEFGKARFTGPAWFGEATFTGTAWFGEAAFAATAGFSGATFTEEGGFGEATFTGTAEFGNALFTGGAWFRKAAFAGAARFGEVTFAGAAEFGETLFTGPAGFGGATFAGPAWFREAAFIGVAEFRAATFTSTVKFSGAKGLGTAELGGARLAAAADGMVRTFPPSWRVVPGADGWQTLRLTTVGERGGD